MEAKKLTRALGMEQFYKKAKAISAVVFGLSAAAFVVCGVIRGLNSIWDETLFDGRWVSSVGLILGTIGLASAFCFPVFDTLHDNFVRKEKARRIEEAYEKQALDRIAHG